jgi:hypothetical protein
LHYSKMEEKCQKYLFVSRKPTQNVTNNVTSYK